MKGRSTDKASVADIRVTQHPYFWGSDKQGAVHFGYIPFAEYKVLKIGNKALQDRKRYGGLLAFKGGRLVGFLYCSVGEFHIGSDVLLTTIHTLFVPSDVRASLSGGIVAMGLMKGAKEWFHARGVTEVLQPVTSGVALQRSHRLAQKMGFQLLGGGYAKSLV